MGIEVSGLFAFIILVADIWAIVSVFQSAATTGKKVFWVVLILILPVIGFVLWLLAGPLTPSETGSRIDARAGRCVCQTPTCSYSNS